MCRSLREPLPWGRMNLGLQSTHTLLAASRAGVRMGEATSQPKTPGWDSDFAVTRSHRSHFLCHHGIHISISPKLLTVCSEPQLR